MYTLNGMCPLPYFVFLTVKGEALGERIAPPFSKSINWLDLMNNWVEFTPEEPPIMITWLLPELISIHYLPFIQDRVTVWQAKQEIPDFLFPSNTFQAILGDGKVFPDLNII